MTEFFATIGAEHGPVESVTNRVSRLEKTIDSPGLSATVNPNHDWISGHSASDLTVLVAGTVFSIEKGEGEYQSIESKNLARQICSIYSSGGISSLKSLNGEFVALVVDEGCESVFIINDRIGALPGFRIESGDGVRISTNIQLFAHDLSLDLAYDVDFLSEYFVFQRSFGVSTPIERVEKLPPSSILEYDFSGELVSEESYWSPKYTPQNKPYEYFVDEFIKRLWEVFDERISEGPDFGVLLSGGSDSRLLLQLLQEYQDPVSYHMNDSFNREAKISEKVSNETGSDFRFLQRTEDYYLDVLERDSEFDNYISWFHQSHSVGFEDQFQSDVLITGLFSDIFFGGYYVPQRSIQLPVLDWTVELPIRKKIESDEIIDHRMEEMSFGDLPDYFAPKQSVRKVLNQNLTIAEGEIVDHGLSFSSLPSLFFSYYPLTNDFSRDYFGALRLGPRWTPFLDNRIIDIQLNYPIKYMLGKNIINDAIKRLNPSLANIQHSDSQVSLSRSVYTHFVGKKLTHLLEKFRSSIADNSYDGQDSWQDHHHLFKNNDLFEDYMFAPETSNRLDELDFINKNQVYEQLESNPDHNQFYPLISILEMPITNRILSSE